MNKRQKKKQLSYLAPNKVPRKTIIRRLKFVGFSGYLSNNMGIQYILRNSEFPAISFVLIKRAYRYNVNCNNLSRIFNYAEDAWMYDFEWMDYIEGGPDHV
jgi:hypothetical protein